jgi:hypothetical protein
MQKCLTPMNWCRLSYPARSEVRGDARTKVRGDAPIRTVMLKNGLYLFKEVLALRGVIRRVGQCFESIESQG